jgi:predicted ester cyclase
VTDHDYEGLAEMEDAGAPAPIAALYAAYNRQDAAAAASIYTESGTHLEVATGRINTGPVAVRVGLTGFFKAFPDAKWTPMRIIAHGSSAAVSYLLTGTLTARIGPFEPCGQVLKLKGVHLFEFDGDKIAAAEDYWDSGTFGRQMAAGDP